MAPGKHDREYDIVLLGATGYTGAHTATAVAEQLPTNLKWAIAGRSEVKLTSLAGKLQGAYPDRLQPAIETLSLDQPDQVAAVVKKAKVCISTVLYHSVGDYVVQACAENGTDYIDCSGNYPQVGRWVSKYHETAKANGTAIIVAAGFFSAPHDLLTWSAVKTLAEKASAKTKEVVLTYPIAILVDPSGGTIESIGSKHDNDPALEANAHDPWYLSPVRGISATPEPVDSLGTRRDPDLGLLVATSYGAAQDRSFIHRTWGLLGEDHGYGPNFWFNEYEAATSTLNAVTKVITSKVLGFLLSSSFLFRYVLRPLFPASGDGPDVELETRKRNVALRVVATADDEAGTGSPARSSATFKYAGGSYRATGVLLAQGAASLLYTRKLGGGHDGGILTPAILGQDYIDRLHSVGAEFETRLIHDGKP